MALSLTAPPCACLIDHAVAAGLEPPALVAEEDSDEGGAGSDDGGAPDHADVDDRTASVSGTSATDRSGSEEARMPDRAGGATGPAALYAFTSARGGDVLMTAGAMRDKSPEYQMSKASDGDSSSDNLNAAPVPRDESHEFAMPQPAHIDVRNTSYDEAAPPRS